MTMSSSAIGQSCGDMEIDRLMVRFYDAFTSHGNKAPNIDDLYEAFRNDARIFKALDISRETYDVVDFIEPRRTLLESGHLSNFREWEVEHETHLFGNIAQRFSRYQKSWTEGGKVHQGGGMKSMQLIREGDAWKIASLVWDDHESVSVAAPISGLIE